MPAGNGVNCPKCPEKLSGKCLVRYCRETESVLNYDEKY